MIAKTFNIAPPHALFICKFVNEAVFGLRESTLLSTITVKMSVLLGCQHGIYAMSFAASVTS